MAYIGIRTYFAASALFLSAGGLLHRNGPTLGFSSGASAALTEDGYQLVASLHSDVDMGNFVKRVLAAEGLSVHSDMESEFTGFLPYFSGTTSAQSLNRLRQELTQAKWVGRVSSLEVENALDTLKSEKLSDYSNASAYALIVANALGPNANNVTARIMIETDLCRKPISIASQELRDSDQWGAQIVFQARDGQVRVTDAKDVALGLVQRPLDKWAETISQEEYSNDEAAISLLAVFESTETGVVHEL